MEISVDSLKLRKMEKKYKKDDNVRPSRYNFNTFVLNLNGKIRKKENKPDCNGASAPLRYGIFYIVANEYGENITKTKNEFKKGGRH